MSRCCKFYFLGYFQIQINVLFYLMIPDEICKNINVLAWTAAIAIS